MNYNSIFGLSGPVMTLEERGFFLEAKPLGFILFSRNIDSADQLKALTSSLKALFPERLVPIFIDQEGGRVARIKPPIGRRLYPTAKSFADLYLVDKERAKLEVRENYRQLISELKEFGIDSACAPVCDIHHQGADPIIGDRSFGNNAEQVVDLCKEVIKLTNEKQALPFIKHIPGHGRASVDSHLDLPIVDTSLEVLESTDFKVFRDLADQDVWAMTAHIVYSAIDPVKPATLSLKVITYIREQIGFKGILVTDDLNMYALHGNIGKQKMLIDKLINLLSKYDSNNTNLEVLKPYNEDFIKLFNTDVSGKNNQQLLDYCLKKQKEIKPLFCKNLAKVASEAISAGCDILLHCSGDLEEMQAIFAVANLVEDGMINLKN